MPEPNRRQRTLGTHIVLIVLSNDFPCFQTPALQRYMFYSESDLLPVMQHIAKNIIYVNEGITKHVVRISQCRRGGVCMVKCHYVAL